MGTGGGGFTPGVKTPGVWRPQLLPSHGVMTPLHHVFMALYLIKHRDNFTLMEDQYLEGDWEKGLIWKLKIR
jgi:hypothetical protein